MPVLRTIRRNLRASTAARGAALAAFAFVALLLPPAQAYNSPPVARAPSDFAVPTVQAFVLNGSGSFDPDGDPLSCDWGWPGAPAGHFDDALNCRAVFQPEGRGVFFFQLHVRDPAGEVDAAYVTVAVNDTPPRITGLSPAENEIYVEATSDTGDRHPLTGPATVHLSVSFSDPDIQDILNQSERGASDGATADWYVDGAFRQFDPGDGSGVDLSLWQGDHHVRALVSDGYLNDSHEWVVHVLRPGALWPFGPAGPSVLFTGLLIVGAVTVAVGLAWRLSRRKVA